MADADYAAGAGAVAAATPKLADGQSVVGLIQPRRGVIVRGTTLRTPAPGRLRGAVPAGQTVTRCSAVPWPGPTNTASTTLRMRARFSSSVMFGSARRRHPLYAPL